MDHLPKEELAAYAYVDSVAHTADDTKNIMWHGWALREAFKSGAKWQASQHPVIFPADRKKPRPLKSGVKRLVQERSDMEHPDKEVQSAIIQLSDALCNYERATFKESVLILREQGGFEYRAVGGKPNVPSDVPDLDLINLIDCGA